MAFNLVSLLLLWGVESNFGRFTGDYNVVEALSTFLAFDGRREALFRKQTMAALRIVNQESYHADNNETDLGLVL